MLRMQWTDEQRAEALELLAQHGKVEAARRTGIPVGTIASWGARHKVKAPPAAATVVATEARLATMAERKAVLADKLVNASVCMADDLEGRMKANDRRWTAQAIATAISTVQLLTGEATERIEQIGGGSTVEAAKAVLADVRERHLKAVG